MHTINEQNICGNFTEIVDNFIDSYSTFDLGKISYDCDFGSIEFVKTKNYNKIIIHEIYVGTLSNI